MSPKLRGPKKRIVEGGSGTCRHKFAGKPSDVDTGTMDNFKTFNLSSGVKTALTAFGYTALLLMLSLLKNLLALYVYGD